MGVVWNYAHNFLQLACKPVPVRFCLCKRIKTGFHHLSRSHITVWLIRPTPRHRTSSPERRYTWSFNP